MTRFSKDEARALSSTVLECISTLDNVLMNRLTCEAHHPVIDGPYELKNDIRISGLRDGNRLITTARYAVEATSDPDEFTAWRIGFDVLAIWILKDDTPELSLDAMNCFALGMGLTTVHPFARQIVHETSAKLGYVPAALDLVFNPLAGSNDIEISKSGEHEQADESSKSRVAQ